MTTPSSFIRFSGVKSEYISDSIAVTGNVHVDIAGTLNCVGLQVKLEGRQVRVVTFSLDQLFPSMGGCFVNNFFIFPFQFILPPNAPCTSKDAGFSYVLSASIVRYVSYYMQIIVPNVYIHIVVLQVEPTVQ